MVSASTLALCTTLSPKVLAGIVVIVRRRSVSTGAPSSWYHAPWSALAWRLAKNFRFSVNFSTGDTAKGAPDWDAAPSAPGNGMVRKGGWWALRERCRPVLGRMGAGSLAFVGPVICKQAMYG
uniref:Secreted protein n=1 Tax=Romanomermis culicivorax TaxID=13658 RepID=A0A915KQK9_ROMCU